MGTGPVIPGNRVYPGTMQHWTHDQRIAYKDFVRAAVWITVGCLILIGALVLVRAYWP